MCSRFCRFFDDFEKVPKRKKRDIEGILEDVKDGVLSEDVDWDSGKGMRDEVVKEEVEEDDGSDDEEEKSESDDHQSSSTSRTTDWDRAVGRSRNTKPTLCDCSRSCSTRSGLWGMNSLSSIKVRMR